MGLMVWQERTSGLNFHNTLWTQQHQVISIQMYTHIRYVDVATLFHTVALYPPGHRPTASGLTE